MKGTGIVMDYSVLMSVYIKEKPEYLKLSLESMANQTVLPKEIVLVEDGPLTDELYAVIEQFKQSSEKNAQMLKVVPLEKNMGLGNALNIGVNECSCELIARMDTDDISKPDRCEKQLKAFEDDPQLDICGTFIEEFEGSVDNIVSERKLPCSHEELLSFSKKRNPFNHMTVMYKKSAVLKAGNYQEINLFEDYYLWARMIVNGAKMHNVGQPLVYARVGADMMKRRGGFSYWKKIVRGRKKIMDTGLMGFGMFMSVICVQFVFCIVPVSLRDKMYKKFLRG